jgi:hypothetical protein
VTKYAAVVAIWYRAYWQVFAFLDGMLKAYQTHAAASRACSLWFQNAADGVETTQGAYRALFTAAEYVLAQADPMHLLGRVDDFDARVPLQQGTLPCDLSRLYAAIWQAAQQSEWDRSTIHRIAKRISKMVPTDEADWRELEVPPIDDEVARLSRRAFDFMYDHQCADNPVCTRSGEIWEREDQLSERWIENERLAREGI